MFYEYGFDYIIGSKYPFREGDNSLNSLIAPKQKIEIAKEICLKKNLNFEDSIAFGDSNSDYPLFDSLKYTAAINADDKLKKSSLIQYNGHDILIPYNEINSIT